MKYLFAAILILCLSSVNAQENKRYININGTSELIRAADQIDFSVRIRIVNESLEESKRINDKNREELLSLLKKVGISLDDISESAVTLGKNYEHDMSTGRQRQDGYFTEVNVSFKLKDLSKYYDLSNKLATSNAFEVISSTYAISDYETQHKASYEIALTAAKIKAEYMAKALGLKLGEVLEIEENNPMETFSRLSNKVSYEVNQSTPISGKVILTRSVRVKFGINE